MSSFGRRLRLLLLLAAFVGGQLVMLAHAAETHEADGKAEAEGHVCLFCLAGHDLKSAVPPTCAGAPTLHVTCGHCATVTTSERLEIAVVRRQARAPPIT